MIEPNKGENITGGLMIFSKIYDCIATAHDFSLLVVAALICVVGSYTAIHLFDHSRTASRQHQLAWIAATGVATGTAIWSTHFIAMLAYDVGRPASYDLFPTLASLIIAIAISGLATGYASFRPDDRHVVGVSGAIVGLGIAIMHYTGMAGYEVGARFEWDITQVLASIVFGCALSAVAFNFDHQVRSLRNRILSGLLFTCAICSMHFTGMSAITLEFDPTLAHVGSVTPEILTPMISFGCLGILMLALTALRQDLIEKQRRQAARQEMDSFADIAMEGLIICDGDTVVSTNRSLRKLSGFLEEELRDLSISSLLKTAKTIDGPSTAETIFEAELLTHDKPIPVEVLVGDAGYDGRSHKVYALRDLRPRLRADERIRHLAHHDALTDLPNRVQFAQRMQSILAADISFSVLFLDLDRFKQVNDTLGHDIGDKLLKLVAERLRSAVRDRDVVARLGGDEFAIIQCAKEPTEDAGSLSSRLIEVVSRSYLIDGHSINIGVSIGIALAPQDGDNEQSLMKHADLALYQAKNEGRGNYQYFARHLNEQAQARRELEVDLRRAIDEQEFELYYQPKQNLTSGEIVGFEALIRWHHPEKGLILPDAFIPLAEETGLINQIGRWVLQTGCKAAVQWPEHLGVSINLAPAQFKYGAIIADVSNALTVSGLEATRLELEITENVILYDGGPVLKSLEQLRLLGVSISLDDFGTGQSALSYLQKFTFDRLKIDRSFICNMIENQESAALVHAIIDLANALGIDTTAEGIETVDQLDLMRERGCSEIQGYLISRPVPVCDLARFLKHQNSRAA